MKNALDHVVFKLSSLSRLLSGKEQEAGSDSLRSFLNPH